MPDALVTEVEAVIKADRATRAELLSAGDYHTEVTDHAI